ncbi:MAG TPA: tryptophan synthase subunit alpha [Roseiflexaceae bacterium]|nr:tryptophan synthase subunit alpha [Roseiflexaceae bacterium]HMP41521.1 tryptophan synthase subunit alpha [Roseiflexaceae bacterium]
MSRIAATFARLHAEGRVALMPYLMSGYPERHSALELAPALEAAGADLFELGVPFSDPLADGATIQRAAERALANGIRLPDTIQDVARMRDAGVTAPIVLMGYYNPFLQYGIERLVDDAAQAGVDGLIIPDLPPEEAADMQAACRRAGLDLIMFVAPTTPDERIAEIVQYASGFIYCVSLTGVTGARSDLWQGLPDFLERVRRHTSTPLVVGFGISTADHVRQVGRHAQGAIVASALINAIDAAPAAERIDRAAEFVRGLHAPS